MLERPERKECPAVQNRNWRNDSKPSPKDAQGLCGVYPGFGSVTNGTAELRIQPDIMNGGLLVGEKRILGSAKVL